MRKVKDYRRTTVSRSEVPELPGRTEAKWPWLREYERLAPGKAVRITVDSMKEARAIGSAWSYRVKHKRLGKGRYRVVAMGEEFAVFLMIDRE